MSYPFLIKINSFKFRVLTVDYGQNFGESSDEGCAAHITNFMMAVHLPIIRFLNRSKDVVLSFSSCLCTIDCKHLAIVLVNVSIISLVSLTLWFHIDFMQSNVNLVLVFCVQNNSDEFQLSGTREQSLCNLRNHIVRFIACSVGFMCVPTSVAWC